MAKRSGSESFVDVDTTTLKPSPQRIRNILTLEERVAAIKAYECRPMYTKVAKMFNCSWEQIKNIITNRAGILEFYEATKNAERQIDPKLDDARNRKIEFLGECVYEYIQRLQFHTKADITEELIRSKAYEFRDVMRIDTFVPNKAWINHFKATYNFSLSNRQLTLTRTPPGSLELRDIWTFCTKQASPRNANGKKTTTPASTAAAAAKTTNLYRNSTKMALTHENEATAEEVRQRRQRKISFLERALLEYATRAKFHLKVTIDEELLCGTAATLRDMLKIETFQPTRTWLKAFKSRYDFDAIVQGNLATSTRTPPLSLDLKDILSYCSRLEKNSQISAADSIKCQNGNIGSHPKSKSKQPMISVVPNSALMPMSNNVNNKRQHHPLQPPQHHRGSLQDLHRPLKEIKEEVIDLDDDEPILTADDDYDDNSRLVSRTSPPPLKIRKIESMCETATDKEIILPQSPGHWSETSDNINGNDHDHDDEQLPKTIRNYADALKLIKPLEEFALLEENFRAIGLLEQLESIFKNPPSKHQDDDEEED